MSDFVLAPSDDGGITVTHRFRTTTDCLRCAHLQADPARHWQGGRKMALIDCRIDAAKGGGA